MKHIFYWLISLFVYFVTILFFALKIKDTVRHPEKYAHNELVEKGDELERNKTHFVLFKSLSHQYSMVCLLFVLGLLALEFLLVSAVQKLLVGSNQAIFMGETYIGVCALMFFDIPVGMSLIPLAIKTPYFEVATRDVWNVCGRQANYKRSYAVALAIFALTFPFAAFATNDYCYFNEREIAYSNYFQFGEQTVKYEDIDGVKIYIHHSNNGKVDTFVYEIMHDGQTKNINKPNTGVVYFTEEVFEVHKLLESQSNCVAEITPLNDIDKEFISKHLDSRQKEIVEYILGGFHR